MGRENQDKWRRLWLVSKASVALDHSFTWARKDLSHRRQAEHWLADPSCPLSSPATLNDQWPSSGSTLPSPKSMVIKPEDMRG